MGWGTSPVQATLTGPGSTAGFIPKEVVQFNAWVLAGSWTGPLYLEKSHDFGMTYIPIIAEGVQLYVATRIGVTTAEESESGVLWRWTAGAGFSGSATVRLSQ